MIKDEQLIQRERLRGRLLAIDRTSGDVSARLRIALDDGAEVTIEFAGEPGEPGGEVVVVKTGPPERRGDLRAGSGLSPTARVG